jgi:AcrR family transcriptional regulator
MDGAKTGVRAAKAARTRARIVRAAHDLFVDEGYEATTLKAIASAAGVAEQTLYFTFGNKRSILSAVLDVAIAGDIEPVATLDRPWVSAAMAAPPATMIAEMVRRSAEIHDRVANVLEVVRSAAPSDPDIAELWRTNLAQRRTVCLAFAGALAATATLRNGRSPARAADIMVAVLSPESYRLLTTELDWTQEEWTAWAIDALTCQLLSDRP